MKKVRMITIIIINLLFFGFKLNDSLIVRNGNNSQVIRLLDKSNKGYEFRIGVSSKNVIYAARGLWYMKYDDNFSLLEDSGIYRIPNYQIHYPFVMSINKAKTKIVYVRSLYTYKSEGELFEIDLKTYNYKQLLDVTENVSSAVYLGNSDSIIVYYSLGKPEGTDAGYYKMNVNTGERELILNHYSTLGSKEIVKGFDISPDGRTMLIPDVGNKRPPIIKSYDLITKKMNQAIYEFDNPNRDLLWIRYNNEGTKILYSNYGQGALSMGQVSSASKMGILNLKTLEDRNIIFKPEDTEWGEWTAPFPNWSPDNKHIIYGMSQISAKEGGLVSIYQLYVKTNIEEEISEVNQEKPSQRRMKIE